MSKEKPLKPCDVCKKAMTRTKYCKPCAKSVHMEQNRERVRRKRLKDKELKREAERKIAREEGEKTWDTPNHLLVRGNPHYAGLGRL